MSEHVMSCACHASTVMFGHIMPRLVMSVVLVATWNCWISYKNGYAAMLVFHLVLPLNPWLIVEI